MILGVDFDNTIVCYDTIFHRVALERGLIPAALPQDKSSVRDHLRQIGRERDWTEMQGYVYGPRLIEAQPYPGVLDFFRAAVQQGIELRIISHKTRHPFLGEQHDLHAAAWGWLEANGFFDRDRIGIRRDQVFLEPTKESKHHRIGAVGCTHFIDDLPEFLLDPGFPAGTERIHFDPCAVANGRSGLRSVKSWHQLGAEFLASSAVLPFARSVLGEYAVELSPLSGGANNRICHARSASGEIIIKAYHHSNTDHRDRFTAERNFYQLELPQTPKPLAWDADNRLGAFTVVQGRKLAAGEVTHDDVKQCIRWICTLQSSDGRHIAPAADACLTIQQHISLLQRRLKRLLDAESDDPGFKAFVRDELTPHVSALAASTRTSEEEVKPVLSPSDFGFHNALKDAGNRLWFFDFEYAGWDDPAKLLCDYFCQPRVPVSTEHAGGFVSALQRATGDADLPARFRLLLPVHAAKWACILLNEFITADAERRRFAGLQDRRAAQLDKARGMLSKSVTFS